MLHSIVRGLVMGTSAAQPCVSTFLVTAFTCRFLRSPPEPAKACMHELSFSTPDTEENTDQRSSTQKHSTAPDLKVPPGHTSTLSSRRCRHKRASCFHRPCLKCPCSAGGRTARRALWERPAMPCLAALAPDSTCRGCGSTSSNSA